MPIVWRDAVCNWFFQTSGIPDQLGRVGHYPGRIEAEAMHLQGYAPFDVVPRETRLAEGQSSAPLQSKNAQQHLASMAPQAGTNWMSSTSTKTTASPSSASWSTTSQSINGSPTISLPTTKPNGDSSTRRRITGLALRPGDTIRIEGAPDGEERAAVDYVEIHASPE